MVDDNGLALELENVRLDYGSVTAIDGISLKIGAGKIVGLLGRNGSGKTSLLSVAAGFRRPTQGRVSVGGEPVWENHSITRQICLIRESGDTVDKSERVAEALRFAASMRPRWDADLAAKLVDRFELDTRARIAALSRGKRSALGAVLGLAARAPLTMFDETYLGMDAPSRYAFYDELLADYMANPRTVIVSTHLIEEVARLFEEAVIIDRGRLLVHDETDRLLARGSAITGTAEAVDRFVAGRTVIGERRLGRTKSAMVFGPLEDADRLQAMAAGLDVEPISLQDLLVHLTGSPGREP